MSREKGVGFVKKVSLLLGLLAQPTADVSVKCRFDNWGIAYVIRSFLSLPFLRPPKAILVPGMYFLGFSRYSNCDKD